MAGVEQNRHKTNNGCIKHLPQTGLVANLLWQTRTKQCEQDLRTYLWQRVRFYAHCTERLIYLFTRAESLLDKVIKFTELVTGNDWKAFRQWIVSLLPEMFVLVVLQMLQLPLVHRNFQEFMEYLQKYPMFSSTVSIHPIYNKEDLYLARAPTTSIWGIPKYFPVSLINIS